jgi:hypothetical protein
VNPIDNKLFCSQLSLYIANTRGHHSVSLINDWESAIAGCDKNNRLEVLIKMSLQILLHSPFKMTSFFQFQDYIHCDTTIKMFVWDNMKYEVSIIPQQRELYFKISMHFIVVRLGIYTNCPYSWESARRELTEFIWLQVNLFQPITLYSRMQCSHLEFRTVFKPI